MLRFIKKTKQIEEMSFLKYFSLTLTTILFCLNAQAQTGYGLRLGSNFADYTLNMPDSLQIMPAKKTGLQVGVFYNVSNGGAFSIQPEVNFSQKGIRFNEPNDIVVKRNFNYFEFNLLGKTTISTENVKAYLNLGPGVSYLMAAQNKSTITETTKVDLDMENIRRWDTVIHVGLGAAFRLGFENALFVEGRYSLSIKDLNNIDDSQQPDGYKTVNHRVLGFTIGYIYYIDGFEEN